MSASRWWVITVRRHEPPRYVNAELFIHVCARSQDEAEAAVRKQAPQWTVLRDETVNWAAATTEQKASGGILEIG